MMYWIRRFFGFLASRTFWVLVGVVALSFFIWFAGPLFAFADYRPLDPERMRWRCIGIVAALYVLWLLVSFWRRRNINSLLLDRIGQVRDAVDAQRKNGDTSDEVVELQGRFSAAAKTLKSLRVEGQSRSGLGSKFIYELPWYVIVGAPGSGKTTALVNSGLDFPLAGQYGKAALQGVGGTRNCDWWFTDQAVVIDTAGRYTTQDSDESVDKREWEGFLGLLKKYRPRQPINGVMLTLSASDLLTPSEDDASPRLRLEIKVVELDPSVSSMALDVDGTLIRYAHGPQISQSVVWPGPRGRQQVSLQISDMSGGQSALSTDGSWALHRFFDKLTLASGLRADSFTATATVSGKKVVFEVHTSSVHNPFRLTQMQTFACPSQF